MSDLKLSIAQLLIDNFKGATSKKASDMAIAIMAFVNADREREIESAFCGTPGTGECSCRKFADNPLKCDNRRTQPEAAKPAQPLYASNAASTACEGTGPKLHVRPAAPAQDLSEAILAIPLPEIGENFQQGFRTALCKAATLASPADALVAVDSETTKDTERLDFVLENGVPMMRNGEYRFHGFPGKWFKTDREAIDFAIQAQKDGHG